MSKREAWILFLIPLVVRLGLMLAVDSPAEVEGLTPWQWGHEPACIAVALERGDGFADPFQRDTGPTGWLPPLYPVLLAVLMRSFGGVTPLSAGVLYVLQSVASALTCVFLAGIGHRMRLPRVGRIASLAFALHPMAVWYSISNVWDTILVAAGLAGFVYVLFGTDRDTGLGRLARLGAGFGLLLLLNPAPASVLPVVLLYLALGTSWRRACLRGGAFVAGMLLVTAPWMIRNELVLGTPGLRSNLGVELYVGNNDLSVGVHRWEYHPGWTDAETARLKALGEAEYAREAGEQAQAWIRAHPARFLWLSLKRAQLFWLAEIPTYDTREMNGVRAADDPRSWIRWGLHFALGVFGALGALAIARRSREGMFLAGVAVLFPLAYYVTHVLERYRFPIDPLLVFLAAYLVFRRLDARVAPGPEHGEAA